MSKKFIQFIFFLLSISLLASCGKNKEEKVSNVESYYFYNNNPVFSIQTYSTNYDTAFQKIKDGKLVEEDFQHFRLDELKKNYTVNHFTISLNENLKFGIGIKLTNDQAKQVISILYKDAKGYLDFINEFEKVVVFTNPNNSRYRFSDEEGHSIALVPYGLTIFGNSADSTILMTEIDEPNETVVLGNTLTENEKIELDASNFDGNYTADIGELVNYKIPIQSGTTIEVELSPNFVVDTINANYTEEIQVNRKMEGSGGGLVISRTIPAGISAQRNTLVLNREEKNGSDIPMELSEGLANLQSIKKLLIDTESIDGHFLEITGHIASSVNYAMEVQWLDSEQGNTITEASETIEVPFIANEQGIYVKMDGKYLLSPLLESSSINFAMIDGYSQTLLNGSEYILGRIDKDGRVFVLNMENSGKVYWKKSSLSQENVSEVNSNFILKGNSVYYTDGNRSELPYNRNVWAYSEESQRESNSALLKLKGLSSDYKYFLKQVTAPVGYDVSKEVQFFTVSSDSDVKAQFANYQVNGYILGQEYGQEEYNALATVRPGQKIKQNVNPYYMAALFIAATVVLMSGIGYFVIRRG